MSRVFLIICVCLPVIFAANVFAENIHSRSVDWQVATNKFIEGANYHGTVADDSLMIGLRGPHYNYLLGTFFDDEVTITVCEALKADFNDDCRVNLVCFAEFTEWWFNCTKPNPADCS